MTEDRATRRKRLYMRSIRRGIREMDLILGAYADRALAGMEDGALDAYERLLDESDHDLYAWISGQARAPEAFMPLVDDIAAGASGITAPRDNTEKIQPV
ncbi:MAG: hypothetical protein HLUCCA08_11470 [Rhodobacteraceae bacterium HLUCCA08]|nr:MAG: hypothetical protein HLUCCA08_11470 [Rhodobacteraceae bacterium HLUCCA08]